MVEADAGEAENFDLAAAFDRLSAAIEAALAVVAHVDRLATPSERLVVVRMNVQPDHYLCSVRPDVREADEHLVLAEKPLAEEAGGAQRQNHA